MRRLAPGSRGASAVEMALLIVAIALVLLPAAFFLGKSIKSTFVDTCGTVNGSQCAAAPGGGGGPGGGGPGGGSPPTTPAAVEDSVADQLEQSDPPSGKPQVSCPNLTQVPPPAGTQTTCTATYASGATRTVVVRFTDDQGNFTIT